MAAQHFRQRVDLVGQAEHAVVAHAVGRRGQAGQDGRVRRQGDRVAGVGSLEQDALGRQAVQGRGARAALAVGAEEIGARRVESDEQDVPRPFLAAGGQPEAERGEQDEASPREGVDVCVHWIDPRRAARSRPRHEPTGPAVRCGCSLRGGLGEHAGFARSPSLATRQHRVAAGGGLGKGTDPNLDLSFTVPLSGGTFQPAGSQTEEGTTKHAKRPEKDCEKRRKSYSFSDK